MKTECFSCENPGCVVPLSGVTDQQFYNDYPVYMEVRQSLGLPIGDIRDHYVPVCENCEDFWLNFWEPLR
jgi:hypothetical protein